MANRVELGTKFNKLTFSGAAERRPQDRHLMGEWICECGKKKVIAISRVIHGASKACGCGVSESKPNLTHGQRYTRAYSSWSAMKYRCGNPSSKDYPRYGAAGIKVFPDWLNFENFFRDMGERPKGTTIDRIDGTKGYEPGNCRWAKIVIQNRNIKSF